MPRLPFKLIMPKDAVAKYQARAATKAGKTEIANAQQPLRYDSSRVYMQVGSALKASEAAQTGLIRIARLIGDAKETKELQEAALLERLEGIVADIDDLEKVFVKFELGETRRIAKIACGALESARVATSWFQKFLANHNEEDAETYKPIAARLQSVVADLVELRKGKISDTLKMEEAYNDVKLNRQANLTHPVVHRNLPYPAAPTPSEELPLEEVLQSLRESILEKERKTELTD